MALDPYDRVIWRGKTMDNFSVAFFNDVEEELGRSIDTVYQGSYNKGITESAETHDEGGALDWWDRDPNGVVWVMRKHGGMAYNRAGKGSWIDHGHTIVGGCKTMSEAARRQWNDYVAGGDALGDYNGQGDYHRRPDPIKSYEWGQGSSKWAEGVVYVGHLRRGRKDSDSVRRLQYRLKNHKREFARYISIDGNFGEQTEEGVQFWQRNIRDATGAENRNGMDLNNIQANVLFGENYRVLER